MYNCTFTSGIVAQRGSCCAGSRSFRGLDPFKVKVLEVFIFHGCFAYGCCADIVISTISSKWCWLIDLATERGCGKAMNLNTASKLFAKRLSRTVCHEFMLQAGQLVVGKVWCMPRSGACHGLVLAMVWSGLEHAMVWCMPW